MNRKTLGALFVFILLLGIVYYLYTRPEKGEREGARPRPLAAIDIKQVKQVTITRKGKTVVLARKGKDRWQLTKPVSYPADKGAVEGMMDKLKDLEFGDLVTELKGKHAEHEVDDAKGIHVVVAGDKKPLADFHLGKVLDSFTMFRMAKKEQVWQAVGSIRFSFDREVKDWREKKIVDFKAEQARKLKVTTAGGAIELSRPDEKTPWKVDSSAVKIDQLDAQTVTSLVSTLSSLSAADFADGLDATKAGFDKPAATLVLTLKGGKQTTLLIGSNVGEDYRVKAQDNPQIFVLKKYTVDNLLLRPIDFREKTVLSLKADDVVALKIDKKKDSATVTLTRKGADWLGDGKKVKDATKIAGALQALANLKAEGFARHDSKELGLDKPGWVVEVQMKDRSKHVLSVGSVEKDGFRGLTRKGFEDIFSFRQYTLDRILLDPKDYK